MRPGGVGAGLIAVCLWGLAPVATRSLVSELPPLPLLTLRQLLAAGVLLPWAVPALRRIDAGDLPRLIAAGLLGMVGYNLPVTVGLQWLPASSAGLLLATEPVWVLVIGLVFLAERAGLRIVLGREELVTRARRFAAAWPQVQARGVETKYADLRYPNGFALRQAPPSTAPGKKR